MPFYLLHQPVIILIAYFFVLWVVGIFFIILISSFLITLGFVELQTRPTRPVRRILA